MQIRRDCFIIPNDTLAFTLDEIKSFYSRIYELTFDSKTVKQIYHISEGWAGGLVILGEILQRMPKAEQEEYLSRGVPKKFKAEVFQYLGEEVFAKESVSSQNLYIKSAMFDFVETEALKSLLPTEAVDEFLNNVARRNMFAEIVYSKDEKIGIRYHKLFHDFLKSFDEQYLLPLDKW